MKALLIWAFISLAIAAFAQPDSLHVLWDRSGAGANAWYGVGVYALGDQNHDGYNDFMIWGLGGGAPGTADESVVELFHGGNPPSTAPYLVFTADPSTETRFYRVGTAGDVNNDGYVDWWIEHETIDEVFSFKLYYGGPDADTIPDVVIHTGLCFPIAAGDFNGDGFDDMCLRYEASPDSSQIYFGGSPMDTIPDWVRHSPAEHPWETYAESFGDLNGDGYSDFVSDNYQDTFIFQGSSHPDTIPTLVWSASHYFQAVILPSLNADPIEDVIFAGFPQWTIHLGGGTISPTPTFMMNFISNCSWNFATGLGDINGDGYNDMCVIDPGCYNLWVTLV